MLSYRIPFIVHFSNVAHTQARVILAIYLAAKAHGIDLPYPTTVMLYHDQIEATEGNRASQREVWPAGGSPRAAPPEDAARRR